MRRGGALLCQRLYASGSGGADGASAAAGWRTGVPFLSAEPSGCTGPVAADSRARQRPGQACAPQPPLPHHGHRDSPGTGPAPARAQPRRWSIAVVETTTMEHRRGYGPPSQNRNTDQAHHEHHPLAIQAPTPEELHPADSAVDPDCAADRGDWGTPDQPHSPDQPHKRVAGGPGVVIGARVNCQLGRRGERWVSTGHLYKKLI
jgi:hypothetical protein